MIQIEALPAFTDNYLWLLQDHQRKVCAIVDPGDARPVLQWLDAHPGWTLSDIVVTHHHPDHIGGVAELKAATGARVLGPALESIPLRDVALEDNQQVEILGLDWQILHVPGHTLGHIAYYHADPVRPLLLCGDTLFAGGCGRLFEGTAEQMHHSLSRLAALPEQTLVYCTHEYTLSNLRFACAVEPDNPALAARFSEVTRLRESNQITLPTSIAVEKSTNPFLRSDSPAVRQAAARQTGNEALSASAVFAAIRSWKDRF
ncbi:hydroxyacylglutathione hydrolase [Pseudomonas sp. N040]|uniref:hydroxyacylglutathione hydrolase n=1 Tax=Pseudomonas sp. N040 TaxID=2785325 RepID=UPI0018A2F302|nr:hydroxyacylglutathione hydrolase [Pseudomonas sp. N040]MBF7730701.1 hydroxyacylglutathione hydrolase [Pseudomonas sp. N040]MBW7014344.1 hydroxyacylglutathione hydrolase [Pseudomonas sp. N040]